MKEKTSTANGNAQQQRRTWQDSPERSRDFWQAALRKEAAEPLSAAAGVGPQCWLRKERLE